MFVSGDGSWRNSCASKLSQVRIIKTARVFWLHLCGAEMGYCLLLGLSATGLACPGLLWTISLCAHRAHQRYAWRSMISSREIHSCVMMFAGMLPVLLASHNGCLAACRAGETRSRLKTGCPKPLSRLQLRVGDWTDLAALKRNITSQPQLVSAMKV